MTLPHAKRRHYMNSIIYIGIDVHKSSYSYCAYEKEKDSFFAEHKSEAGSKNAINYIKSVIKTTGSNFPVLIGYEAGPTGYKLCRDLQKAGFPCVVIAPSTIYKPNGPRIKTDRRDARLLAQTLAYKTFKQVVIPYDNLYQLIKVEGETVYNPYLSSVPEFISNYSQVFSFDTDGLGNTTSKVSKETVTPQKSIGDNLNYSFDYVYDENFAHRLVRAGNRYYKYDANGNIICEQDGSFESNGEDVAYHKITQEAENLYSTDYGWGLFKENDSNSGIKGSRYFRTYTWNERNQLISSVDANYSTAYVYGQDGQRSNKYTANSETLYFNKMWILHTDSGNSIYGGQTSKNIYLGETRVVTKLNSGKDPTYQEEYYKQYYYHSDHLGSASLISDYKGDEYQRIEYTPYGETWVEKTSNTGLEYLPYKFTAKELDQETGLYYYGARYLDPK